jgi:hypothetical protein
MPTEWQWTIFAQVVIVALIVLFNRTNPKRSKPKKNFWSKLQWDPPITPQHARPLATNGYKKDKQFFEDFRYFGDVLNWMCSDEHVGNRWRVQERDDTHLSISPAIWDGPLYGRRYELYFGSVSVGKLEIEDGYEVALTVWIEIQNARLFSYSQIRDFLDVVIAHVGNKVENYRAAEVALLEVVWDGQRIQSVANTDDLVDWGELTVSFSGNAEFYFSRRDCEAFQGIRRAIFRTPATSR